MPEYGDRTQLFAVRQFGGYNRHNDGRLPFAHVKLHHRMLVFWWVEHALGNFGLQQKLCWLKEISVKKREHCK